MNILLLNYWCSRSCVGLALLASTQVLGQGKLDTAQRLKPVVVRSAIEPDPVFQVVQLDSTLVAVQPNQSIDELLKFQTNLYIRDYGSGALSSIAFRGYNSRHTAVFWEGMPVSSNMNKTFDAALFPSFLIDDVSIQYGAAGMINGSGGLGGTINLSSSPTFDSLQLIRMQQTVSTINNAQTGLQYVKSNNKFYSSTHFSAQYGANEFSFENPSGKTVETQKLEGASLQVISGQQKFAWKTKKNGQIGWNSMIQTAYRNLPYLTQQRLVYESQRDLSLLSNVTYMEYIGNGQLTSVAGFKYAGLRYSNKAINIDDVGIEQVGFGQVRYQYQPSARLELENAVIYQHTLANHPEYNDWKLQQDLQHIQRASFTYKSWFFHGLIKTQLIDDDFFPVLPSIGAKWTSSSDWFSAKGNIAYHAMAPSLNDLYWSVGGNPDLVAERGWTSELGVQSQRDTGLNYSLTAFWSRIEDRILWEPANAGLWTASNIENVTNQGVELSSSYRQFIGQDAFVQLSANYSYNQAVDSNNNQLAYLPKHRVAFQGLLSYKSIRINYGHRFTDKRFLNASNTGYLPSFFNSSAGVTYALDLPKATRLEVGVFVYNLYNEPFQEVANRPMPNRYISLNIKLTQS